MKDLSEKAMNRIIITTILLLFAATLSFADDISISADVDKQELSLDDQLTLSITVNGSVSNIPQPKIPALEGFTSYSSGRSQNISIINGQVTSSVSFNYILVPNKAGDYSLGPFTVEYKGKVYSAGPIDVQVLQRSAQGQQQPQSYAYSSGGGEPSGQAEQKGKELFIETYVDKLTAYVNEQITLTFAFYQAVNLFDNPVYNAPFTTGFWVEDMPPQKKYYKVINNVKYLVAEIKTALFAISPGKFTISPARLEASVEDMEKRFPRNPFDMFDDPFSMFKKGKPIILTTDPITVEILPLPEKGKPSNFKGDVGNFDISADIDKDTVEENQPVTLKVAIKGKGNIKTISRPSMPDMDNVKIYDSANSENISKENYVVQGEKIFEKMIIPKTAEDVTAGPIKYSYFDPSSEQYVEKVINAVKINVTKAKEDNTNSVPALPIAGLTKEEVKLLKRDIAYIKTQPVKFTSRHLFLYKNKIFLAIHILLFIILIAACIYELHRERLRTDIGYARSRSARNAASKRLKLAKSIMIKGKTWEFYAEIYKAAIEYIADRLNIPHPSVTKGLLEERLKERGFPESAIEELKDLFDMCDMARFAPNESRSKGAGFHSGQTSGIFSVEGMKKALDKAADMIAELEGVK